MTAKKVTFKEFLEQLYQVNYLLEEFADYLKFDNGEHAEAVKSRLRKLGYGDEN